MIYKLRLSPDAVQDIMRHKKSGDKKVLQKIEVLLEGMEINPIKTQLSIPIVLNHYNLSLDRNIRINCPFHNDKTPSMQVYKETNTVYNFSSNCKLHGKTTLTTRRLLQQLPLAVQEINQRSKETDQRKAE